MIRCFPTAVSPEMPKDLMAAFISSQLRSLLLTLSFGLILGACQPKARGDQAFAGAALQTQRCEDGLVVETVQAGKGEPAAYGDQAQVHYIARLHKGKELSRSHDRNPQFVPVGRKGVLVEGLHRGLVGMRVGELRRVVVPKDLGYRGRKVPGVPPDATLEFWVELFSISKGPAGAVNPKEQCPS